MSKQPKKHLAGAAAWSRIAMLVSAIVILAAGTWDWPVEIARIAWMLLGATCTIFLVMAFREVRR